MGCAGSKPQDPAGRILRRIVVTPWNVLGVSVGLEKASKSGADPGDDTLLLACSPLEELRKPSRALGKLPDPLGAVARFIGAGDDSSFPDDVLASIKREGDAAYHRYGYPTSRHVIHVASVDFGAKASSQTERRLGLSVRSVHRISSEGTLLCLSSGSVTDFEGDAIVNAANEGCIQGAGVDDAINVAGGPALRDARLALPVIQGRERRDGSPTEVRCPMGEVRVTIGGGLKASWCIHAVGPNYNVEMKHGVTMEEVDKIVADTYRKTVEAAKDKGVSSIAFCLVSAGMFRGKQSLDRVLAMGLSGIQDAVYPGLKEVHVVAFTPEEQEALGQACTLVFPGSEVAKDAGNDSKISQAAAVDKLAGAYSNILSVATQVDRAVLRLSPVSCGQEAAHFRSVHHEITAASLVKAVRSLPVAVRDRIPGKVELCVEDPSDAPKYERALKEKLAEVF